MKNLFKKPILFLAAFGMIALAGCKDDDEPSKDDDEPSLSDLKLEITGLEDLGSDFVYEGWVITTADPISTGTFTVNEAGAWSASTFKVDSDTLAAATKFVLTIEPKTDTDPKPSKQKLLAGDFSTGSSTATVSTAPAVGDFSMAAGTFFLRTPTDEATGTPNNGNDEFGIWFGTPGMPPTANLTLPTLPDGWTYEGWVVVTTASVGPFPISTGTFKDFGAVDSGNPYSGTENAGPPVPGEDFLTTSKTFPAEATLPLDLRGKVTVISVEPVPDNSPKPFLLKPLKATISETAELAPTVHNFEKNLDSLPTGTATR